MGVRLPTILGKAIDDVWKTVNQESEEERIVDLVNCIHRMDDLMGDLQNNSKLRPIKDDGAGDIALWNKVSATQFHAMPARRRELTRRKLPSTSVERTS